MTVTTLTPKTQASTTFHHCRAALGDRVLRLQDEPLAILKGLYRLGALVVTTFADGGRVSQSMRYPALLSGEEDLESRGSQCRRHRACGESRRSRDGELRDGAARGQGTKRVGGDKLMHGQSKVMGLLGYM